MTDAPRGDRQAAAAAAAEEAAAPLAGMRVVDMAEGRAELCGRYLADLGAEVIRVEPPGGVAGRRRGPMHEGVSLSFALQNANKRSVTIDIETEAGAAQVRELLGTADVWLETMRPGGSAAAGVTVDAIRAELPGLVIVSVTDFGQDGPYRDRVATEPVLAAMTAVLARSGLPGREPLLPPAGLISQAVAIQAAWATLLAYWNRLETGLGDHVDISSFEAAAQIVDPVFGTIGTAQAGNRAASAPTRGRPRPGLYPIFPCADGHVRLVVLSPRQWRAARDWVGMPERFEDPSFDAIWTRMAEADALAEHYAPFFATRTADELAREGQARGVPIAPVMSTGDVLAAAHYRERGAIATREISPGLQADIPTGFVEIDGARVGFRRRAPLAGEDDGRLAARPQGPGSTGDAAATGRPLAGLRVLDLGVIVMGAEAARLLADQGAEVIKIENRAYPDGSRVEAASFAIGHRNLRGFGLNLRSEGGVEVFKRLAAESDVLLSNFKPGTLEKLGLGPDVLREINPRLVTITSSAVGATGPWRGWMGYGPLVRCAAGLTAMWRYPDDADSFSDSSTIYPDHFAARIALIAGLAVLIRRRTSGRGAEVETSQAEAILVQMGASIAHESLAPGSVEALGNVRPDSAPWGVYPCAGDDEWVAVTVGDEAQWRGLCRALGGADWSLDPALSDAAARVARRAEIDGHLAAWTAERSPREAAETLQAAGVPAGPMYRVEELEADPHLQARGFFRILEQPGLAPMTVENGPCRSRRLPDPPIGPAPQIGEHTREICVGLLGLDEVEVDRLIDAGVLEAPEPAADPVASLT